MISHLYSFFQEYGNEQKEQSLQEGKHIHGERLLGFTFQSPHIQILYFTHSDSSHFSVKSYTNTHTYLHLHIQHQPILQKSSNTITIPNQNINPHTGSPKMQNPRHNPYKACLTITTHTSCPFQTHNRKAVRHPPPRPNTHHQRHNPRFKPTTITKP